MAGYATGDPSFFVLLVSIFSVRFFRLAQVGNKQLVILMAETMGKSVDPSALVGMEDDDEGAGLSQVASQPE